MKTAEKVYSRSPSLFQNIIIPGYDHPPYKTRYEALYYEIRKALEKAKGFRAAEIKESQKESRRQMVNYCAKKISYYKNLFSECRLQPNYIAIVQDLKKLLILNMHSMLEQNYNFLPTDAPKPFMIQHTSVSIWAKVYQWAEYKRKSWARFWDRNLV